MIKYYSTLNDELYETEYDAQKAEDEYVEEYFTNLSYKVAVKNRKLRHISDPEFNKSSNKIKSFKIQIL